MSFSPSFEAPIESVVVETALMENVMERTMAVHNLGGLVAWAGRSGSGKSTTARLMVHRINKSARSSTFGFSAVHYEVGPIMAEEDRSMVLAIKSLYGATVGRPPEYLFRKATADALALTLVQGLRSRNIRMIFVDEAGLLSTGAIRGIVLAIDTAENESWPVTAVLIGMDELPVTLQRVPQTQRRVRDWCYFRPMDGGELARLVVAVWPTISQELKPGTDLTDFVDALQERFGNVPGTIAPALHQLRSWARRQALEIDTELVSAMAAVIAEDRASAKGEPGSGDSRPPVVDPLEVYAGA